MSNYPRYRNDAPIYGDTTGQNYSPPAPRVPGQRYPMATIRSTVGPNGSSETFSAPYQSPLPQQAPGMATVDVPGAQLPVQMPFEQLQRRQNMGLSPRGPSPQFAASGAGQQRFGSAPMASYPQQAPMMMNPQLAVTQMREQGSAARHYWDQVSKTANAEVQGSALSGAPVNAKDAYQHAQAAHPLTGSPTTQPSYSGAPIMEQGSQNLTPAPVSAPLMPYTNPQTGAPQMNAPITDANRLPPMNPAERAAKLRIMYGTAAADLDKNPQLGTTPVTARQVPNGAQAFQQSGNNPNASVPLLTDSQAHRAVEAGPAQTQRNMAATQRRQDAETSQQLEQNAAQMQQNQSAANVIGQRMNQFDKGNYDISQPVGATTPAAAGRAVAASRAAPTVQPTQQQGPPVISSAEQHAALPNGTPFIWNGKQYIKGQAGQ